MADKEGEQKQEEEMDHSEKFSCASVASTDVNDKDKTEHDNEEKKSIVLGPPVALKDLLELDKDDESLRKWKEQLFGNVDLNNVGETLEPEVHIMSLMIISPGRPDLVLPIPLIPNYKGYVFRAALIIRNRS